MAAGEAVTFMPAATQAAIPCCLCGTVIMPNAANMCANCIRSQVDIAEGIQKQVRVPIIVKAIDNVGVSRNVESTSSIKPCVPYLFLEYKLIFVTSLMYVRNAAQVMIVYCKSCGRYLVPPKQWIRAELESKELLTFCIKRIKGLQKVKLIDASFIWTEPHSKRIKVRYHAL